MTESKKRKNQKTKIIIWSSVGVFLLAFFIGGYFFYQHIVSGLPSLEELENPRQSLATNVLSADGEVIGQYFRENRREIDIDSIPTFVIDALVATEDRKFYDHWGVDLERFVKAMIKTIFLGKREGASTITQQLSKNLYDLKVIRENLFQTIVRKIREWFTAVQIEQTYTKKEILEMYLNNSFFGNRAYGIEMAAQHYFGKSASELKLTEAAVFIALLKSSVYYNPIRNPENATRRRNVVLYNMYDVGFISEDEYEKLKEEPIVLASNETNSGVQSKIAPHFVEHVRRQLEELEEQYNFNLYEDGLKIYTSLDSRMQHIANKVTAEHLNEFQQLFDKTWNWNKYKDVANDLVDKAIKREKVYLNSKGEKRKAIYDSLKTNQIFVDSVKKIAQTIEVGFVCLDVSSGEIKAMVGGRDQEFNFGLNHVTQIKRQPGSSFKPIIYSVALNNGLYPAYPILNQEFEYGDDNWNPHNFDMSTGGFLTLRDGLRNSVNLISARLIIEGHVQLWQVGQLAKKLGINTRPNLVPSISLGTSEVIPLELVSVYATLANKGIYNEPSAILKIEDKDGIILMQSVPHSEEAMSEETTFLITNMLETVINEGTGMRTRSIHHFYRPAAGKTGTTQDYSDAWFMGFTPQLAAGVWVGFDDRRVSFTGSYGQGAKAANPIWSNFMREVYDSLDFPEESFTIPESGNIVSVKFCKESIYEYGNPKLYSNDCSSGEVDDYINIKDIPISYNSSRDKKAKLFTKFYKADSLAHEAIEITEEEGL
ncbi:MAG: PBP1A family penicillin-binding protein [Ignavibacteriales bacterium]|nr:PBP1A family penicillin-binding protein [Ignavibacteriales bacterium]